MRTWTQHNEQAGGNGCLVLPILQHRYLVKYGPGGVTFLTHIHNIGCIYMCWDYYRYFIDLYVDTFQHDSIKIYVMCMGAQSKCYENHGSSTIMMIRIAIRIFETDSFDLYFFL